MSVLVFVLLTVAIFAVLGGGAAVSVDNIVGLVLVIGLVVFLITALLFPERF